MPTPEEYLDRVGEEKILQRVYLYEQVYTVHVESFWFANHLSLEVLRHCVDNYFIDIERLKDFHGSERVNRHRQAAYTLKWVSKLRPIQMERGHAITDASMYINEIYAIHLALAYLRKAATSLDRQVLADLLYDLHFRPTDGEVLTLVMRLIDATLSQSA